MPKPYEEQVNAILGDMTLDPWYKRILLKKLDEEFGKSAPAPAAKTGTESAFLQGLASGAVGGAIGGMKGVAGAGKAAQPVMGGNAARNPFEVEHGHEPQPPFAEGLRGTNDGNAPGPTPAPAPRPTPMLNAGTDIFLKYLDFKDTQVDKPTREPMEAGQIKHAMAGGKAEVPDNQTRLQDIKNTAVISAVVGGALPSALRGSDMIGGEKNDKHNTDVILTEIQGTNMEMTDVLTEAATGRNGFFIIEQDDNGGFTHGGYSLKFLDEYGNLQQLLNKSGKPLNSYVGTYTLHFTNRDDAVKCIKAYIGDDNREEGSGQNSPSNANKIGRMYKEGMESKLTQAQQMTSAWSVPLDLILEGVNYLGDVTDGNEPQMHLRWDEERGFVTDLSYVGHVKSGLQKSIDRGEYLLTGDKEREKAIVDALDDPVIGTIVNLVGEGVIDPMNYVSFSAIKKISALTKAGKIDEAEKLAQELVTDIVPDYMATRTANRLGRTTPESVERKLSTYLLEPNHPEGGSKAIWFRKALGYTKENISDLANQVSFNPNTAVKTKETTYGIMYSQTISIKGANGRIIDTQFIWIKNKDGIIRLVTCVPTKK